MLGNQLRQIRIFALVILRDLIKLFLGLFIRFLTPCFPQPVPKILALCFGYQIQSIPGKMKLAPLPYRTREMLLDGRVDPRMIIAGKQPDSL